MQPPTSYFSPNFVYFSPSSLIFQARGHHNRNNDSFHFPRSQEQSAHMQFLRSMLFQGDVSIQETAKPNKSCDSAPCFSDLLAFCCKTLILGSIRITVEFGAFRSSQQYLKTKLLFLEPRKWKLWMMFMNISKSKNDHSFFIFHFRGNVLFQ